MRAVGVRTGHGTPGGNGRQSVHDAVTLGETIRFMAKIDGAIPKWLVR